MHIETRYLLNIGLRFAIGDRRTAGQITPGAVLHELYGALDQSPVRILKLTPLNEAPEPTVVVELDAPPSRKAIFDLSCTLWQDCIAAFDLETGEGELIGRRAAEWGAFDPCYFLLPNGQPLDREERVYTSFDLASGPDQTAVRFTDDNWALRCGFKNPQPNPLTADNADFSDFGDCNKLALLGIFYIDAKWHRAKRAKERAAKLQIDGAYEWLGLDRNREMTRIRSEVADLLGDSGIWPTSSSIYTSRRNALDRLVLGRAERQGYAS